MRAVTASRAAALRAACCARRSVANGCSSVPGFVSFPLVATNIRAGRTSAETEPHSDIITAIIAITVLCIIARSFHNTLLILGKSLCRYGTRSPPYRLRIAVRAWLAISPVSAPARVPGASPWSASPARVRLSRPITATKPVQYLCFILLWTVLGFVWQRRAPCRSPLCAERTPRTISRVNLLLRTGCIGDDADVNVLAAGSLVAMDGKNTLAGL
jgi:hypothetical protein